MNFRVFFVLFFVCLLVACDFGGSSGSGNLNKKMQKFEWLGSLSAPNEYPVEIYDGRLIAKDFTYGFSSIWGIVRLEWGNAGGVMSSSAKPRELPYELQMTWYSVVERKFYTGSWQLDQDAIYKVWQQGGMSARTRKKTMFNTFIVGLAPGGKLVLWAGGGSKRVQLATFQAEETVIQPEDAREDFEFFFRPAYQAHLYNYENLFKGDIWERLQNSGWPDPKIYDDYELIYNWKFTVSGLGDLEVDYFYYRSFNGEYGMPINDSLYNAVSPKTIPKHIYAVWKDVHGDKWVADLEFDFDRVKDIYAAMGKYESFDIRFDIRIDAVSATVRAYLDSGREQIELPSEESVVVTDF